MTQEAMLPTADGVAAQRTQRTQLVLRRIVGFVRIAASLLVLASIATQIGDKLINDVFLPEEYFSYFTIQTSIANIVVFFVGGVLALRTTTDPQLFTRVRMSMVAYAVVTGVVYEVLLRRIPPEGYVGIGWPNEVLHVGIPILIVADWLLAPGRAAVAWSAVWVSLLYPAAWLVFTLVRGGLTGWYPYPFLEPDGPAGIAGVVAYVAGIAAFVVIVTVLAIAVSRLRGRRAIP